MASYYNEIEPYAAEWLRNLIKAGYIPDGEVDTRSIVDVQPLELRGFTQCHFFAGIGGWGLALRLAGWSDNRQIWTGSCPCQPFSVAGKGAGTDDPRHLWPHFHRLIAANRPPVVMGEQVAGKAGYGWFDGVQTDLEGTGYASRAVDIPALAVNAPHIRQRLYWIACDMGHAYDAGLERRGGSQRDEQRADRQVEPCSVHGHMADANVSGLRQRNGNHPSAGHGNPVAPKGRSGHWDDYIWAGGSDGKARRIEPCIPLLVNGVSNRVGRLRAYGNAIVPPLAAEVIIAFLEAEKAA